MKPSVNPFRLLSVLTLALLAGVIIIPNFTRNGMTKTLRLKAPTPMTSTIIVTTTVNTIAADGQCSLREAIINANNDTATHADCAAGSGADTIVLTAGATYTLNARDNTEYGFNGLPAITSQITIEGNGATITRSASATFRLFYIASSGNLTLRNIVLRNGLAAGGNGGTSNGGAGGGGAGLGGAIYNRGVLSVLDSTLNANTARGGQGIHWAGSGMRRGGGGGGGLGGNGGDGGTDVAIERDNGGGGGGGFGGNGGRGGVCADSTPQCGGGGGGGTITSGGTTSDYTPGSGGVNNGGPGGDGARTSGGSLRDGVAGGVGGGGGGGATYTLAVPSGYHPAGAGGNGGIGGGGGGGGNKAGRGGGTGGRGGFGGGGGGAGWGSTGTSVSDGGPGGAGGFGGGGGGGGRDVSGGSGGFGGGKGGTYIGTSAIGAGSGGGGGCGGAIFNESGTVVLSSCTFSSNLALGGSGGGHAGGTAVAGTFGADGGSGFGGALFNYNGSVTITDSTFTSNSVTAGAAGPGRTPGSPGAAEGCHIYNLQQSGGAATITLTNTTLHTSAGCADIINNGGTINTPPACQTITLSPPALPPGRVNFAYNQTIMASGGTAPYSFAVTNGSLPDGISLSPSGTLSGAPSASDTFNFTVTATDSNSCQGTFSYSLTINPNNAPDAVDDPASTNEDTAVTVSVLANDTDANGSTLSISSATVPANGNITINPDGTITYTPNANFNGADSFGYTISDGNGGSDTAAVTVTVVAVNDTPDAVNDSATTAEDTAVNITVLGNDTDVDGNSLTVTTVTQGANGTVAINANGTLTYTPNSNFNGTDSFTYTVSDGAGGSDTATVSLTITEVNDAPEVTNDSATTAEDTSVTIAVLGNDTDVDGNSLTVTAVTQGSNGSASINSDGTVTYTPNANFNGSDSFSYTVSDGNGGTATATVAVSITAVNDMPTAMNDSFNTNEDVTLVVAAPGVKANDSDIDGNPLTAALVVGPTSGSLTLNPDGSFSYAPAADFFGTISFTYKVNDGTVDSAPATVTITVNAVNDPPVPVNDAVVTNQNTAVTVGVLANDTDIESHALGITSVTQGANGMVVINSNGTVTYTPNANFTGTDAFTYTISDGNGGTATATVTVTINAVTTASIITVSAPAMIANGGNVTVASLLTSAANIPLGNRTVTLSIGSGAATQSCTATTSSTGLASCTITGVNQPLGPGLPVQASFAGDTTYFGSSASTITLVFAYAVGNGGGFIIGDQNAAVGTAVTFWGAQWAKKNTLSGGNASNSFKGFANRSNSTPVTCGSTWFTDPGNSSDPPASVPSYMAVIVASTVTKSGSTISGNTTKVVIVRTNAGYSDNPGHSGTGTIVGILCQ